MKVPEVLLVEIDRTPGSLAKVLEVVADAGLMIENLNAVSRSQDKTTWEVTLEVSEESDHAFFDGIEALPNAHLVGRSDRVFTRHIGGKIETVSKVAMNSQQLLRDIYTPGVARVCLAIRDNPDKARQYTNINNTVAIVTNGTAILGLGDIGPVAGLPVMEGKAALFHELAGISGVPILLQSKDPDIIVETVVNIAPSFGAIQLEDIASPECFDIEQALIERLDIPVLHDDQHGTAVVALAALLSATRQVEKDLKKATVGQVGLGAAGLGISRLLLGYGVKRVLGTDLNKSALNKLKSLGGECVSLDGLMAEADIIVATTGVKNLIKPEMVCKGQLILALTNPDPEIEPDLALKQGASFAADGKSVNNVSAFPGLFRGALDANARRFTDAMLFAAAETLSAEAPEKQLIPDPLDREVHKKVAAAVEAAVKIPD